eukprot:Gb_04385 [translate_table: standard]
MVKTYPLKNQNKKVVFFAQPILHRHSTKDIGIHTDALQTEEANNDHNGSKSSHRQVRMMCKQGRWKDAVRILHLSDQILDSSTYERLLHGCFNKNSLPDLRRVHTHMNDKGFVPDIFLANTLLSMYAKCESLVDARRVFDQMLKRNVITWTVMIAAYVKNGCAEEALALFYQMQRTCIQPNHFTFVSVLPACANLRALKYGKEIHREIIRSGFHSNVFVGSALVDMYVKCGSMENARHVFDKIPQRDVVSWNKMIAAYAQNGQGEEALTLFYQLQQTGIRPNQFTFASILPACADLAVLEHGRVIHEEINRCGFQSDLLLATSLIDMYIKCRNIENARNVFDKMAERDVVSWNKMIAGYAQNGHDEEALRLVYQMQETGIQPNQFTFNSVLPACANFTTLEYIKEVHEEVIRNGFQSNIYVASAIVDMYVKLGSIDNAREVFETVTERDVVLWNKMIAGYAHSGYHEEALTLFYQMRRSGFHPNHFTFASVLPACASLAVLEHGKEVHEEMIRSGLQSDVFLGSALVDVYLKCRSLENARDVFDTILEPDVVSWNAMIAGYAQNGHVDEALKLFQKMPRQDVVSWTAMVAGYAQNGHVDEALKLFQEMPERDVVSWNAMIAGYAQNGYFDEALKLFQQMQQTGLKPVSDTFASVLPVCANLASLERGKEIHEDIIRNGFQSNVFVGSALVDLYAKCGSIEDAYKVFETIPRRNVVLWNAMIVGYAMHGCGKEALQLFAQMQLYGANPDHVTFLGILSACCHGGLVDDGRQYFECMTQNYLIVLAMEHYCCMVDLLGRAGCLNEALDFINKMPIKPNAAVWGSLLGACRIHTNIELAEHVAGILFELDTTSAATYVQLSNIYAAAGRWDDIKRLRRMMKDRRVKKKPGCSWIEVNKQVHAFLAGDKSHPQTPVIYAKLETLSGQMKEAGYIPDTRLC